MKNDKSKFTETLKLFDNKEYKSCKKECIKILEKNPQHIEILALKGITLAHLGEKEEGLNDLKNAIKLKMTNPIPWHFSALYYKEDKNYSQALKNYGMAIKYDPQNFNLLREQSYLQLYLRLYESFQESCKKGIELKSNLVVNWVSYGFSCYLNKNFKLSEKIIDSALKIAGENIKPYEMAELTSFMYKLLVVQEKYQDALAYLKSNEKTILDKTYYNEQIYLMKSKLNLHSEAKENVRKLLTINVENISYFLWSLNIKVLESEQISLNLNTFNDVLEISNKEINFAKYLEELKEEMKDNKEFLKSKVLNRLELAFNKGEVFTAKIEKYFKSCIMTLNTSIYTNIKWIYKSHHMSSKLELVTKHIDSLAEEINKHKKVYGSDLVPHISWLYYYLSIHNLVLCNLEQSLNYINQAIDLTPSVVEFFMLKSKILAKVCLFDEANKSYEKAKKLDIGDRFLNAKHAKIALRSGNLTESVKIMKEFVKDPLLDENIDHIQTTWYILETINFHLKQRELPQACRLIHGAFGIFNSIYEDQFDFFNYCLRRNVVNQLIGSLEYMDTVFDNANLYKVLEYMDFTYEYLNELNSKEKKEKESFENDYLKLNDTVFSNTKYKFKSIDDSKTNLLNDLISILLKLQSFSQNFNLHYICVKYFTIKKKFVLALKSLNFLKLHAPTSIYYYISQEILSEFIKVNDLNVAFKNISKEVIGDEINKKGDVKPEIKKCSISDSAVYFINQKNPKPLIESFLKERSELSFDECKHLNFKDYSKLLILSSLFVGLESTNEFEAKHKSKFKIFNDPKITIYNLDLYEIFNEERKPKLI